MDPGEGILDGLSGALVRGGVAPLQKQDHAKLIHRLLPQDVTLGRLHQPVEYAL